MSGMNTSATAPYPSPAAVIAVNYMPVDNRRMCRIACLDRIAKGPFGDTDAFEGAQDILTALDAADARRIVECPHNSLDVVSERSNSGDGSPQYDHWTARCMRCGQEVEDGS